MKYAHIPIKDWPEADQPREKMLAKGRAALSDAELLAILIRCGRPEESAVAICQRILCEGAGKNLAQLSQLSDKELCRFRGIGKTKAVIIMAALELARRVRRASLPRRFKISSSGDAYEIARVFLADLQHEELHVLYLNQANNLIGSSQVSRGGLNSTVADVRIIFKQALDQLAAGIILCHNHPSGNLQPSEADLQLTCRVAEAGKLLQISLLDHLIVTESGYYSFADNGKLS